jgi:phenylpropionate dioxygenase-like ring-hydroxylating dioxygenase large terminal subunit
VGLIWGYIGEVELLPPPPLVLAPELESPEWTGFICEATWRASWLRILDNLTDPMHGPYLHGRSYTLSGGRRSDRLQVTELDDGGFVVERKSQRGVNLDWIELHLTGTVWNRLDVPYPWSAGPGGPLRIVSLLRPHDEHTTTAYFLRYRQVSGWKRWLWRTLYRRFLEAKHWEVLEQDRAALEGLRGIESRLHEHLCQSDVGIISQRRMLQRELARQQLVYASAAGANGHDGAVAAGGTPEPPALVQQGEIR